MNPSDEPVQAMPTAPENSSSRVGTPRGGGIPDNVIWNALSFPTSTVLGPIAGAHMKIWKGSHAFLRSPQLFPFPAEVLTGKLSMQT